MKRPISLLILLAVPLLVFGQKEASIWYFGSNAGMDFNAGSPVNLVNGKVYTTEGSAVMCDTAGSLLFYTDGIKVWDKNHVQMANGNNLHGGSSSSQSALIIQQPSSDSLYYIFTVGEAGNSWGLQYSIVDMSLQGGLGEVILKNQALVASTTEKVTAIPHANGTDYWVVTHDLSNADFYAYHFSAAGVNATAVVSTVGSPLYNVIGCMKGSHNGKKIAFAAQYDDFFEMFDFNQSTGEISNAIHIDCPPTAFGPYGIEFAPNDSVLYGTAYSNPCVILQWDISSNDEILINNSQIALDSSNAGNIGSLQLAPDGKIYMAKYGTQTIGVVNNPNIYGFGCNYDDLGFNLAPKSSQLGLPNVLPTLYGKTPPISAPGAVFSVPDSTVCETTCLDFQDLSSNNPTSWLWTFDGGLPATSTDQNPSGICYSSAGTFAVTLVVTNAAGSDTLSVPGAVIVIAPPAASAVQSNDTLYATGGGSYQWYSGGNLLTGATNSYYLPSAEGEYVVEVTGPSGCSTFDTIQFKLTPFTALQTPDTLICQKFCIDYFDATTNYPVAWIWTFEGASPATSTLQNPSQVCYNTPGEYDVTLITTNAFGSDTLILEDYITVYATPPFPTITQNGWVLTCSNAFSYQWQIDGTDIPGATGSSYTVTQSGLYTVIVTDENGCANSAGIFIEITGLDELPELDWTLSPNPNNGSFTLSANGFPYGDAVLHMYNALGQRVYSAEVPVTAPQFKMTIDLDRDRMAGGIHLVELNMSGRQWFRKILIAGK